MERSSEPRTHVAQVRLLLARGADADLTDSCGLSPLMMAARKGHIGVIRRLLEAGANPDLADQAGNGPRFYAVRLHVDDMHRSVLIIHRYHRCLPVDLADERG